MDRTNRILAGVGWSNGATIMNNFAALQNLYPEIESIDIAATLACPFDMPEATTHFKKGFFGPYVYDRALASKLVSKISNNVEVFKNTEAVSLSGKKLSLDLDKLLASKTVREIDRELTCKTFDYPSVRAYYEDASCNQRLKDVCIPLMLVSALDDPICPSSCIPYNEVLKNENLILVTTRHGGHIGWCEQGEGLRSSWIERVVIRCLNCALNELSS